MSRESIVKKAFSGQAISQISFDFRISLLGDGGDLLVIEQDFDFVSPTHGTLKVDPERASAVAEPLLELLHRSVVAARLIKEATLVLDVQGGFRVEVGPSDEYEAWDLILSDGSKMICMPCGDLAIWGPDPQG